MFEGLQVDEDILVRKLDMLLHRYKEQTFGLCGRRQGWDGFENSIETCILPNVK